MSVDLSQAAEDSQSPAAWHGTYAGYRIHGCRCYPCAGARSAYDDRRSRLIAYGRWKPFTDAGPVREHVLRLMSAGIGRRRISALTGVSESSLCSLLYGKPGRAPSTKVRPQTAAALFALEPETAPRANHGLVPATGFHRRTRALVAVGFPQAFLARRFGRTPSNFLRPTDYVTVRTDLLSRQVYDELWNKEPLEYGVALQAANRARNLAAARRWAPPQAWDDERLDDPKARPTGVRRRTA